jgi:hypothetical protein
MQGTQRSSSSTSAHVKTLAKVHINYIDEKPTHPPHMGEVLTWQVLTQHKTQDIEQNWFHLGV